MREIIKAHIDDIRWIIADPLFLKSSALLIGIDLLFVLLHIGDRSLFHLKGEGFLTFGGMLSIDTDGGIPEIYSYLKTSVVIAGLISVFRRTKSLIFLSLSMVFLLILLDDSLQLHERGGWLLQDLTSSGRLMQDIGELIVWGLLGCIAGPPLITGYLKSDQQSRRIGIIFMILIGLLMVFGVGIDILHSQIDTPFPGAWFIMMLAEDAGELGCISLACAATLVLVKRFRPEAAIRKRLAAPGILPR